MMKPATVFLSVIVRFLRNGYGDRDWNIGRTWITKLGGTRHFNRCNRHFFTSKLCWSYVSDYLLFRVVKLFSLKVDIGKCIFFRISCAIIEGSNWKGHVFLMFVKTIFQILRTFEQTFYLYRGARSLNMSRFRSVRQSRKRFELIVK